MPRNKGSVQYWMRADEEPTGDADLLMMCRYTCPAATSPALQPDKHIRVSRAKRRAQRQTRDAARAAALTPELDAEAQRREDVLAEVRAFSLGDPTPAYEAWAEGGRAEDVAEDDDDDATGTSGSSGLLAPSDAGTLTPATLFGSGSSPSLSAYSSSPASDPQQSVQLSRRRRGVAAPEEVPFRQLLLDHPWHKSDVNALGEDGLRAVQLCLHLFLMDAESRQVHYALADRHQRKVFTKVAKLYKLTTRSSGAGDLRVLSFMKTKSTKKLAFQGSEACAVQAQASAMELQYQALLDAGEREAFAVAKHNHDEIARRYPALCLTSPETMHNRLCRADEYLRQLRDDKHSRARRKVRVPLTRCQFYVATPPDSRAVSPIDEL